MLEVEGQLPVGLQLFGMQQHPCLDQFALLAREVSLEQIAIEGEGRFMSLVSGVDVRGTWSSAFMVMMIPKNMLMTGLPASLLSLSSILGYFSFDRMVKRKRQRW